MTKNESTMLLPPIKAVQLAWAQTGFFSKKNTSKKFDSNSIIDSYLKNEPSIGYAKQAFDELQLIKKRADNISKEKDYVSDVSAAIYSSLRNLHTIYKGRDLNFNENEKLRSSYLQSLKKSEEFGNNLVDYVKSIPGLSIGGVSGYVIASNYSAPDFIIWLTGIGFALLGMFITGRLIYFFRVEKQWNYIVQDYERNLYYFQYLGRVTDVLKSLYNMVDQAHEKIFGQKYSIDKKVDESIEKILIGLKPTYCDLIHKHIQCKEMMYKKGPKKGKIISRRKKKEELWKKWTICETGIDDAKNSCPFWFCIDE